MSRTRLAVLAVALLMGACRDDAKDLTGTWTGNFDQVAQNRAGTIRLELSQSGSSLGGRWEVEIPENLSWGGRLEGTVAGSTLTARLVPDDAEICPYSFTASFDADRIEGPYEAYECRVEIAGRIDVRRR